MSRVLSTKIQHDDGRVEIIEIEESTVVQAIDESLYDADGLSFEMQYGCAVRILEVDKFVAELAVGDEYEQAVAAKALEHAQFFALVCPGRVGHEYGDPANDIPRGERWILVHRNRPQTLQFTTGWSGGMRFVKFYPNTTQPVNLAKKDEEQPERGEAAPGIVTPVLGFDPGDDYLDAGASYISFLKREVTSRRNASPGSPGVSPSRRTMGTEVGRYDTTDPERGGGSG
jgi:hypothetical protein